MTPDKLQTNLEKLRASIARKPTTFSPDYAKTIPEAFSKYTRTSTINLLLSIADLLAEYAWPFPAYHPIPLELLTQEFNKLSRPPRAFQRLRKPTLNFLRRLPWRTKPTFQDLYDQMMIAFFCEHRKQIKRAWHQSYLLEGKEAIITETFRTYRKGYWAACICVTFPLLDLLFRRLTRTQHLGRDITELLSMFRQAGIAARHIKPGYAAWDIARSTGTSADDAIQRDLRLVGIALGSFVEFADIYYAYYRKESPSRGTALNRHAILHGASDDCWTKANATRLLTFVDLTLRLEPALRILLKED